MQEKIKYTFSSDPTSIHMLVVNEIEKNTKVLDIGCAGGYIGDYLVNKKNCEVCGIEPDLESYKIAKEKGYISILNKNIEDSLESEELENKKFDYIILADVLEHLVDPENVLFEVGDFLREDGKIIISLPNIAHYSIRFPMLFGQFDMRETGILDRTHLHFYTLESAKKLLENFKIIKIRPRGDLERWFRKIGLEFIGKKILFLFRKFFAVQFVFVVKK